MKILKKVACFIKAIIDPKPTDSCLAVIRLVKNSSDTHVYWVGGPHEIMGIGGITSEEEWLQFKDLYGGILNIRKETIGEGGVDYYFDYDLYVQPVVDIELFNKLALSNWVGDTNIKADGVKLKETKAPFVTIGDGFYILNPKVN